MTTFVDTPSITPWCALNVSEQSMSLRRLEYERAAREGIGVASARSAYLMAMREWEERSKQETAPRAA